MRLPPSPDRLRPPPNLAFAFDDALLQLADPGLEMLDELTECAILGLKVDVARYAD